ncbi:MAG: molybdopterin cofactor-binding domain-containing protein [Fimbriimonadaceae bacterium]
MKLFELTRRQVLKALGGGFLVAVLPVWAVARLQRGQQAPQTVDAWLHISGEGTVTVLTGKVEVGQNARTSVTQAVAEELRVSPSVVKVVMGDTDLVPFDRGTFGSQTTPQMIPQIRRAAVTMREALVDMAAEKLGVARSSLVAADGVVSGCGGSVTYGELAAGAKIAKAIPREVALTPVSDWKVMGTAVAKVGADAMVTGAHKFSSDMTAEGMLYAKVLRAPSLGAKIGTVGLSKAQSMSGVRVVRDGEFVAVAAPTLRQATAARDAIAVEWVETSRVSTSSLTALFGVNTEVDRAVVEGTRHQWYSCAYIAHAPPEPRAALAAWDGDRITVHTGTSRPFGVRTEVATALGISEEKVRVIVPDTGSGYGGKHSGDAAVEAARVSKALGVPVKLAWTREEEFKFAYCRPGGVVEVASVMPPDGRIREWSFVNHNSGGSALETPYNVGEKSERFVQVQSPIRQGSYRALAATFNNFARESHMNELAHEAKVDPLEFRLRHLTDERMIAVLEACAEKFGWKTASVADRHGIGIACGTEKNSFVATAVEIVVNGGSIRVLRAVTAYECGKVLNPALLKLQVDGAVLQGLGGALFERVEYSDGRCVTAKFSSYRVPRFSDAPKLETVLLDRPDLSPAGAGETPIMAIAPAINGALLKATGAQRTAMPLQSAVLP